MPARRTITPGSKNPHGLEVESITSKRRESGKLITLLICKCPSGVSDDCLGQLEVEASNFPGTKACRPCAGWMRSKPAGSALKPAREQTLAQKRDAERKLLEREHREVEDAHFAAHLAQQQGLPTPASGWRYGLRCSPDGTPYAELQDKPYVPTICGDPDCEHCNDTGNRKTKHRRLAAIVEAGIEAGRRLKHEQDQATMEAEGMAEEWAAYLREAEQERAQARARFQQARETEQNRFYEFDPYKKR